MPLFRKREMLARAASGSLVQALGRALRRPGLNGLTYHRVVDFDTLDDGVVSASTDEFEWQVTHLKETVRIMSGEEILAVVNGTLRLDEAAVFITFDDGYSDNLQAGQILARHGVPAIFFVTSSFVGSTQIADWDRLAYVVKRTDASSLSIAAVDGRGPWTIDLTPRDHAIAALKKIYFDLAIAERPRFVEHVEQAGRIAARDEERPRPPFMSWDDVRALHDLGHSIGAHTHNHPILSQLSAQAQEDELRTCRDKIADEVGIAPKLLAYPNGKAWTFGEETKQAARAVGIEAAFSFYGGYNVPSHLDAFDLRRGWVSQTESRDLFRARVAFPQIL